MTTALSNAEQGRLVDEALAVQAWERANAEYLTATGRMTEAMSRREAAAAALAEVATYDRAAELTGLSRARIAQMVRAARSR